MINLYKKDETTFEHNGLGSLDKNILNPEISWKDNSAFTLEFKYPLFAKHGFEIENSSIIRANDPEGSNLFFVYKITPSMGYVTVLCYQISYKLAFNSINDTNIVNKSGQNALSQMSAATQYPHSFMFSSDIQTTATSRVVRKNPIEFLLDTSLDNSFVNRWGGHIVRHSFNIAMNSAYGSNKGYTIRHKKDLKGYEAEFDESTVITRIRAIGADGLLLPELYVDSPIINAYQEPRIQEIEYSDVKVKTKDTDEEGFSTPDLAYEELRRLAKLEFLKNKVDQPDFSAKVEFVNLKDTQEYQDLKSLKQVLPGDIVKVVHSDDNFNVQAQMVEYKYNPLNQSYISITLGNYTKSFTSTVSKASSLQTNLSQIAQQAQSAWSAANGKNTVYSLTYKPTITGSSVEGDLLYLKNGDKIEMWILEKVNGKLQWVLQVSDATSEELKAQIAQAKADIDEAVDSANNAVDKANENVQAIEANTQLITDVNEIANDAKSQAQTAATNAQTAVSNAGTAMSNSQAAITDAQTALDNYKNMVIGGVNILVTTTDEKIFRGNGAENQQAILSLLTKSKLADYNLKVGDKVSFSATCEISGSNFSGIFTPRLRTAWTNLTSNYGAYTITKAETIKFTCTFTMTESRLANGTGVDFRADNVPSTVSMKWSEIQLEIGDKTTGYAPAPEEIAVEITNINGQLRQKVSQTNFDTLNGTVANQSTQISQNKTDIASKANKTTVDTLTGRVSTAETNIKQNAQEIVLKASKTAVDTLTGRVSTAESSITQNANDIKLKATQADVNKITDKVNAVESSITVQSGQITALNTKTDGQTTQIGSLQSSYDGLQSTVSNVQSNLDNLTIGGRNLLLDTSLTRSYSGNGDSFQIVTIYNFITSTMYGLNIPLGADIFFSYDLIISGSGFSGSVKPRFGNSTWALIDEYPVTKSETVSRKIPLKYISGSGWSLNTFSDFRFDSIPSTVNIAIFNVKFEIGNKPTEWSPAPEDMATVTSLSDFKQDVNGFKTTVANTYLSKSDASGTYADKVSVASQITQSATAVTSNVQSWTNNKLTAYSTTQQTSTSITNAVASKADKSQVTQLSDQITSTVSQISSNSNLFSIKKMKQSTDYHPNYTTFLLVEIATDIGATYTASSDHPSQNLWFLPANNSGVEDGTYRVYSGKTVTFVATSSKSYVAIRDTVTQNQLSNETYHLKVERGISATDWSPSAQDSATQSQVTQLADQITSTVTSLTNETLISTQMINSTTLKHPNYTDMPMVEVPVTSGESYTVSNNISNGGTATAPIAHVWFLRLPSTVPTSNINGVYDGKSITLPALSDKIYIVFRTQSIADKFVSGEYWLKVTKTPASQSQITQLASDINLRVSKGDVTSQINIEAGRTLIDTKQLLLNANTVKFSGSAFIPNSVIENLSADKITAGTLNAANVNVINLNAANITTGILSGSNLSMNLNTGEVLFQKGIIKKTDGSFVIDITNGEISSNDLNGGFSLKSGALKLRRKADNAEYGSINYGIDNNGELNLGLTIVGNNGYMFKTKNYTSSFGGTREIIGSGIKSDIAYNSIMIRLESQNGILLYGGKTFDSSSAYIVPHFTVGASSSDITGTAQNIKFYSRGSSSTMTSFQMSPEKIEIGAKTTYIWGDFNAAGSKNAIHVTRDGVRATPAYETAESYLGDIGRNYTREDCEIWVHIDELFSDTVNTDIAYEVFLQAYDDAHFWVEDFKSDKFLVKSDKPMARFAWEIKAKRRGYENERLVIQEVINNDLLNKEHDEGAF